MNLPTFVYDPIVCDQQSKVRGIGRYLQILKENFTDELEFISDLGAVTTDPYSIFINPFFNFLQPPLIIKRLAQKQIALIHDLIPLKYPAHFPAGIKGNINIALNKYALRNYDLIITDSEASKKDIVNILGVHENIIKVIYPCLPKIFDSKPENAKYKILNTKYCLYVGDATWNKNLVNLAKAIKIANVSCVFVGKVFSNVGNDPRVVPKKGEHRGSPLQNIDHPWMAELKEFYALTKNNKQFIFKGFVSDEELIKLYKQARCNILPSRDEGFGFSYIESASQHCPSVLADISVLKEISDGNALFSNPNNINDLANKIGKLFSNETTRKQIEQKAFKRAQFFSPVKFKKSFLKIIEKL